MRGREARSVSFRFRKSVNLGGGLRLNFSKTGVGLSAGIPGARYSVHSSGRTVRTVGLPGTGMYFRKDTYHKSPGLPGARASTGRSRPAPVPPPVTMYPKAHLLSPKEDKLFVKAVTAYMKGRHAEALTLFQDVSARDTEARHVGEELFAGLCLIALDRAGEAIAPLETVLASSMNLPDPIMAKYGVQGSIQAVLSPFTRVEVPITHLGAALLLAEVYEHQGEIQKGIDLLESLGSLNGDPVFALPLAEMYGRLERWDDVIRVSEGFVENVDDLHLEILVRRAMALQESGTYEGALALLKEGLRFRKRNPELLRLARYTRGRTYEAAGRPTQARREYERVYAEDGTFLDVATRLEKA